MPCFFCFIETWVVFVRRDHTENTYGYGMSAPVL